MPATHTQTDPKLGFNAYLTDETHLYQVARIHEEPATYGHPQVRVRLEDSVTTAGSWHSEREMKQFRLVIADKSCTLVTWRAEHPKAGR